MKSFGLSLTLITAAAVAGCNRPQAQAQEWSASGPTRFCTDNLGRRVPDADCGRSFAGGGGYYPFFINRGGYIPPYGGYVRDGSRFAASGLAYGRAAAFTASAPASARGFAGVSRGGFGASAHASVGG